MPEIRKQTGSDILGELEILPLNIPEFGAFSIFSLIFPPVPPKMWAVPPQQNLVFQIKHK